MKNKKIFGRKKFSITTWIIIINCAIFLFIWLYILRNPSSIQKENSLGLLNYFVLTPSKILQGDFFPSLILHMFTHTMFFHLAINMFVLFSLGGLCEKIIGRKRYLW